MNNRRGFMLLEAILTVVIVSICLTFIVQSLLTSSRTGMRFQESVRSLIAMENRLGLLFATDASEDLLDPAVQPLEKPYEHFTVTTQTSTINNHLKKIGLDLTWPAGHAGGHLNTTTIIFNTDAT